MSITNTPQYDIEIIQGVEWELELSWTYEKDDSLVLNPKNTEIEIHMQIRKNASSSDVICEISTENDRVNVDSDTGKIVLNIPEDVTAQLPKSSLDAVYDILVKTNGKTTHKILTGQVEITETVTKFDV